MNLTSGSPVRHERGVDLVGPQQLDALVPDFLGLAHRDPDVGVQEVHTLDPFVRSSVT